MRVLSPTHAKVLRVIAYDRRRWVTWHATDAYEYTLLDRVRHVKANMSEKALRDVLRALLSYGYIESAGDDSRFALTRAGSDRLHGI